MSAVYSCSHITNSDPRYPQIIHEYECIPEGQNAPRHIIRYCQSCEDALIRLIQQRTQCLIENCGQSFRCFSYMRCLVTYHANRQSGQSSSLNRVSFNSVQADASDERLLSVEELPYWRLDERNGEFFINQPAGNSNSGCCTENTKKRILLVFITIAALSFIPLFYYYETLE